MTMPEPVRNILTALETFAKERGGDLAISYMNGEWAVALTWGREAPDSPMAGAQALGSGMVLEDALLQVAEEAHVELPIGGEHDRHRGEVVLVAERGDPAIHEADEGWQRSITADYDPSCKLVQFTQCGEEVFGTLEPITPAEWQEIVDRLGRAAPFMERVLRLVQEVERIAEAAKPGSDIQAELRAAVRAFAGSIEPEQVVEVAHAADKPTTWDELLAGDSAILLRLGQLCFVWVKDSPKIKIVSAAAETWAEATVLLEIDVPKELSYHNADAFEVFCREFVGGGASPITPDEAAALFTSFTGGEVNPDLLSSVTPKLEVIAERELIP